MNKTRKRTEDGRSMVEMLGVLAIIGVLSVAGVAGYKAAVRKTLANNLLNQASMRATDVATKIGSGNLDSLGNDAFDGNLGSGVTMSSAVKGPDGYTDYDESDEQFTLTLEGLDEELCQQMQSMAGGSRSVVRAVLCDGDKAILTFNKDLSANPVSSDFDGNKEGCESSGRKYCDNDTCIPATDECPTGGKPECFPACQEGQQCIGGACAEVSACTDECSYFDVDDGDFPSIGCTKNSDCDEWCDKNSHKKCYCNIGDYSESSCYPSLEGVCAPARTRSNIKGGYIASYNGMSWWGAVNFCKAHNASMVSLFELGIESGYQNTGECNNSGCKGDNFTWTKLIEDIDDSHYWVKDGRTCDDNGENCTIENNAAKSCLAFQIYSGEEAVTYGYRSEFNDALCK